MCCIAFYSYAQDESYLDRKDTTDISKQINVDVKSFENAKKADIEEQFYRDRTKKGWWWYEGSQKKEIKTEDKKDKSFDIQQKHQDHQQKVKKIKPLKDYTYEELLYMPIEEFKEIYNHYLDIAVGQPTEENIYNFYNIQDVARKKALLFTTRSMYIWQKHPELSTARDVPIAYPGIIAKQDAVMKEIGSYIKGEQGNYGLILFVSPTCPYCKSQYEIVKNFNHYYGWDTKIVDITTDRGAINTFGIETVPTLILVSRKTGDWIPIASGVASFQEMETNVVLGIKYLTGKLPSEKWGLYQFQEGTSLDPLSPSPLWKSKKNNTGKKGG